MEKFIREGKVFKVEPGTEMNEGLLYHIITAHQVVARRYEELRLLYEGDHDILRRPAKTPGKPDNRLVANFARYIVDTFNGYFIGTPVRVESPNSEVNDYLQFLDLYNSLEDQNSELSKKCDIYGHAFELLYLDEQSQVGIMDIRPQECILVRDTSISERPLYGIRYFENAEGRLEGTLSDDQVIRYFYEKPGEPSRLIFKSEEERINFFGAVPIIEYVENEERIGAFEGVETLINSYDKAISEKANDVDYFADSYMKILGAGFDEKVLQNLRDYRVINVPTLGGEAVEVDFMDKPNSDTTQENLLERLERLIFTLSLVANISDDKFQTASGIAMQYKILPMSNLAMTKERKFTRGFNDRYRLISRLPASRILPEDLLDISYTFTRDLPHNAQEEAKALQEEAQTARSLQGLVSDETILENLTIVKDVQMEKERIQEENAPPELYPNWPVHDHGGPEEGAE